MSLAEQTPTLEDILKTEHFDFHKTYPIDKVFPHPKNPRKHSEYEIELLEIGILHFGFTNPILIQKSTKIVIAGHARLKAAIRLGLKAIPVRVWDCSDEQAESHMIADNKISQHSEWDEEHLIPLLMKWREKSDKNLTGFSEEEMQLLIDSQPDFSPDRQANVSQLDTLVPKWVKCPECNHAFDSRTHAFTPN